METNKRTKLIVGLLITVLSSFVPLLLAVYAGEIVARVIQAVMLGVAITLIIQSLAM